MTTRLESELRKRSDTLTLEAIDETLERIFGRKITAMIYDFLEDRFMLEKEEIPTRAKVFSQGLQTMFGSVSSQIELGILRNLCERSGNKFRPEDDLSFADCISAHRALVRIL